MTSLMVKKDGMILEKLISAKASLNLMPVCIASSIVAEKNGQLLVCSLKEEQRIKEFGK